MPNTIYDTIIVGAGAAGLTAAIYASRRNLKTLVLSRDIGGQAAMAAEVENYPGINNPISGFDLMQVFKNQAEKFGAKTNYEGVTAIKKSGDSFLITTDTNFYTARTVILAFGLTPRELNVPGEDKFKGRGVAYCATCDAPLFKNKVVAVVGGGNSALDAAELLSKIAKQVFLVHHEARFSAEAALQKKVSIAKNVEIVLNSKVKEIKGSNTVESIVLDKTRDLAVDGVFIEIGYQAKTDWAANLVKLNARGEIITDENCRTSAPGVFAAGDVTDAPYKQIVVSAGEGAKAALQAYKYLQQKGDEVKEAPDWGRRS